MNSMLSTPISFLENAKNSKLRYEKVNVYTTEYQNLAISSENYRTFPKVGPLCKEKACKFLACSDYSLLPNSCVMFEIFVAWRKINTAQ